MPLLKGKENIGHNVREMEAHGHPKKQAVAAALATAYDEEEEFNSTKKRQAQNLGAIVSHDETYARPVTDMTVADINTKNEKLWHNVGPAPTEAAAPALAGTKVGHNVPVYTGAGIGDEVQPTQSAPPDPRSNNLLGEEAVAGEHDEKYPHPAAHPSHPWHKEYLESQKPTATIHQKEMAKMIRAGSGAKGSASVKTEGKAEDDLAMNTESMPPEGQADGATRAQKAIKKEVKNEAGRIGSIAARQASEGSESAASTAATAAHYARSAMMGRRRPLSTYKGVKGA